MNKRPTPEQDLERLLDEDGGEFGAIYRRLSRPEPPRRLDRNVLASAARAVHGARPPRAQRWALAMGSVTGVVLAAGIAWQVGQQMHSRESVPEGSQGGADSRVVPVEAITEPRPRQKARTDLIMRDGEIPLGARQEAPNSIVPMEMQDKPSHSTSAEVAAPASRPSASPVSPELAKPGPAEVPGESAAAQPASARMDRAQAEAFPEEQEAKLEETELRAERARTAPGKSAQDAAGAVESRDAGPMPGSAATPSMSAEDSISQDMQLSPEAWLEEIERLANSGQRGKAIENLRLFRSQYPDWPVPDALRQLDP